jgi:hypothetical protein
MPRVMGPGLAAAVRGPSYSLPMRIGATVLLLPILPFGVHAALEAFNLGFTSPSTLVSLGAFFGVIGAYVHMLKAVTIVDNEGISQTGLTERKVAWREVEGLRLRRLGATRLAIRSGRGPVKIFVAGTDELRDAFARVAASYDVR